MAVMTEAMTYHKPDPEARHAPISAEPVEGGRFQCACRCGYAGKAVTSSPSHAFQATRVHAENENRREGGGGAVVEAADYSRTGEPPKSARPARVVSLPGEGPSRPPRAPRSRSGGTPGTPCGCGCGEPSGGLFRPGHDSKLLSRLLGEIRANTKTLADAHVEMTEIGTSEVLREKLAKKVNA